MGNLRLDLTIYKNLMIHNHGQKDFNGCIVCKQKSKLNLSILVSAINKSKQKIEENGSSSPHEIVLVSAREKTSLETKISKSNIIDISHDREKSHRKESKLYAITIPYIYRKYLLTDVKNDCVSCFLYSYLNQRNKKEVWGPGKNRNTWKKQ